MVQVKQALGKKSTYVSSLEAVDRHAAREAASQLLQHYLFSKKAMTVTEPNNAEAAISGQFMPSQAELAAELFAQHYFPAAVKAAFPQPQLLSRVLQWQISFQYALQQLQRQISF